MQDLLSGLRVLPATRVYGFEEGALLLGDAANRLSKLGVLAPDGVEWALAVANRNFIIHQYDEINRGITWQTLSVDLPAWEASLQSLFTEADTALDDEAGAPG